MFKKLLPVAALALTLVSGSASAAFTGVYDLANWTQVLNGGSIDITGAPNSVTLTSSNDGSGPDNTDLTIIDQGTSAISFDWTYTNGDRDGSSFDPFGWLLNGVYTQLTANGQFGAQSGSVKIDPTTTGDVFGFRIFATDSLLGSSNVVISNFSTVPEPFSLALIGIGLVGLVATRRHKQSV